MISFKSLQNHLDHSFSRAKTNLDDAAMDASDSGSAEDMRAFNEAQQQSLVSSMMMNEGLRAKHGITKAIIDGIQ
jgi:hypothetical protein